MVNKNEVMNLKDLLTKIHHALEVTVVEKAVKAYNPMKIIKSHHLDCLEMTKHKSGGGSSEKYFKESDKEDVREELERASGWYADTDREKIVYTHESLMMWDRVTEKKVKKFVMDKKELYDLGRGEL